MVRNTVTGQLPIGYRLAPACAESAYQIQLAVFCDLQNELIRTQLGLLQSIFLAAIDFNLKPHEIIKVLLVVQFMRMALIG